jgi:transposase
MSVGSRLQPFIRLARTIRRHRDGIFAAIRLGLSNGRLEGLNSRVRLISQQLRLNCLHVLPTGSV